MTGPRGLWCVDVGTSTVVRLAGAGFDWVCVDLQHGRYDRAELIDVARSLPPGGASLAVRVPALSFTAIGLALDAGATTVIVPQIDTPQQAREAAEACRYPPEGRRSFGQLQPHWGSEAVATAAANEAVTCAIMIESAPALAAVDAIAATPGVDMLFVGPFDLALSLSTSVDALLDDTGADSALSRVLRATEEHGLRAGAFGGDPQTAARFEARGFTATAWATDAWVIGEGVRGLGL